MDPEKSQETKHDKTSQHSSLRNDETEKIEAADSQSKDTETKDKEPNVSESESIFEIEGENEPYLGPSWAILMLVLYALKTIFPATLFSAFWFFQMYIVTIVLGITIFTLVKRHKYFNSKNRQ